MDPFLEEWVAVSTLAETEEEQQLAAEVIRLASECRRETGMCLKFIGT